MAHDATYDDGVVVGPIVDDPVLDQKIHGRRYGTQRAVRSEKPTPQISGNSKDAVAPSDRGGKQPPMPGEATPDDTSKTTAEASASSDGGSGTKPPVELTSCLGDDDDDGKPKRERVVPLASQPLTEDDAPKASEETTAPFDGIDIEKQAIELIPPPGGVDHEGKTNRGGDVAPMIEPPKGQPPETKGGYDPSRFNALTTGIYSDAPLTPWEDPDEDERTYQEKRAWWQPVGIEEEEQVKLIHHLRRRLDRVSRGELGIILKNVAAVIRNDTSAVLAAVNWGGGDMREEEVDLEAALVASAKISEVERSALKAERKVITGFTRKLSRSETASKSKKIYEEATAELGFQLLELWRTKQSELDIDDKARDVCDRFVEFLEDDALDYIERKRREVRSRPKLREMVINLSHDPDSLTGVVRQTTTLLRQLEKAIEILVKLQKLREMREQAS